MRVLFVQFEPDDGPGRLGDGLIALGATIESIRMDRGEALPPLDSYAGLIVMGGTMNALDDAHFPYLPLVVQAMRDACQRGLPTLGVCLGGQLLARALGARVYRKEIPEVGYYPVELTAAGRADPLFQSLPSQPITFQWHEDAFELPEGATLLADSPRDSLQAFRMGTGVGLQFHPEVSLETLAIWARSVVYGMAESADRITPETLLARGRALDQQFAAQTTQLCRNFHALMRQEALARS
ncbi:MAG TPA: type 1 glutamine amidotransferase [Chloroflexota bacterium]|jgi:GMP synthase-like glutamine amidotransferase